MIDPSSFLPSVFFDKFTEIDALDYKAIIDWNPSEKNSTITTKETAELLISQLKELLVHCIVVNQKNDWVLSHRLKFILRIEMLMMSR